MNLQGSINKGNSIRDVDPQFAMTFMGSLLTFLILMLVIVAIWMLIRCIRGIRQECVQPRDLQQGNCQNPSIETSIEDLESGNPMTYHPHVLTIRHSVVNLQCP